MMLMDEEMVQPQRPRTLTVLVLLILAALTFSYLGAYAVPEALVTGQIMSPWPHDADPRPQWMFVGFFGLFGSLAISATLFRFLSWRQFRRIDAMAEGEG